MFQNAIRGKSAEEAGFTLLEVMLALLVLAVVLCAVGYAMARSDRDMEHAQNWTAAYRAAQTVVETLRSQDLATMALQDGNVFQVISTSPYAAGQIEVTDLNWEGLSGVAYEITVTVPDFDVRLTTVRTMY